MNVSMIKYSCYPTYSFMCLSGCVTGLNLVEVPDAVLKKWDDAHKVWENVQEEMAEYFQVQEDEND